MPARFVFPIHRKATLAAAAAQRGFSLVELMVALVISLLIISSAAGLFVAQQAAQRLSEQTLRPTEDRRLAADLISRDARAAGDYGCAKSTSTTNLLNNSSAVNTANRIRGFKYNVSSQSITLDSTVPGATLVSAMNPKSDAVVFFGTYGALSPTASTLTSSTASIPMSASAPIATGDTVLISDCLQSTIFEATGNTNNTIVHAQGTTTALGQGNSSSDLGKAYAIGSEVSRIDAIWYVIAAPVGRPYGLYRVSATQGTAALITTLATQLYFNYGVDSNGDGVADQTVDAASVSDWTQVVQLNFHLLLRSANANAVDAPMTYYFSGATATAPDRGYYAPLDTTVTLRNTQ